MDVVEMFRAERSAFLSSVVQLGANAPTRCGAWTTGDLSVHLALAETGAGWPVLPARVLVARGVRLDRLAPINARALQRQKRVKGYDWAVNQLDRPPPTVLTAQPIAPVSLLEVWAHHEDVLGANDVGEHAVIDPAVLLPVLVRYQRKQLLAHRIRVERDGIRDALIDPPGGHRIIVDGNSTGLALWLAGRRHMGDGTKVEGDNRAINDLSALQLTL